MLAPSEIVQGEESFANLNGNTVDGSGIVTIGTGTDIDPHPWLQSNAAQSNLIKESSTLATSPWLTFGSGVAAPTVTEGASVAPDGSNNSTKLEFPATDAVTNRSTAYQQFTTETGEQTAGAVLKGDAGGEVVYLMFLDGGGTLFHTIPCTLTTSWQEFDILIPAGDSLEFVQIGYDERNSSQDAQPATTCYVWNVNRQLGNIDPIIPIITTTAARTISATDYSHNLANIDTNNSATALEFVAEGESFDILTIGSQVLLSYGDVGDGVELLSNPNFDTDLAGWTSTGDGTAVWGAGTAKITKNTSSYQRISQVSSGTIGDIYILSTVVAEITGTVQAYIGGTGISVVATTSLGYLQTITELTSATPTIDVGINSSTGLISEYTSIDSMSFQKATKGLILDDGTTRTTYPIAAGDHTVGIALGTTDGGTTYSIQLTIDGVAYPERSYTPIAQGLIDIDATHWLLRSDVEDTYLDAQNKLLVWNELANLEVVTFEGELVTHDGEQVTI